MSTAQIRQIKIYGELADFLGFTVFDAAVTNAAEAVRCLVANFPKLEAHMSQRYYKVIIDKKEIKANEFYYPTNSPIKIIPVVGGEGGKGLGNVLIGAAMIGLAFASGGASLAWTAAVPGVTPAVFSGIAFNSFLAKAAVYIGAGLVLGGVSQMLTPVPPDQEEDPDNSFAFASPTNTAKAGAVIPLIYGQRLVGSSVISASIDVAEVPTD